MKKPQLLKSIALALALAVGLGVSAYAHENEGKDQDEQVVDMASLPAAVQNTIQYQVAGGTITRVVKEVENGNIRYSADIQKPTGEKLEVKVAEDGKLARVNADQHEENSENEGEHAD